MYLSRLGEVGERLPQQGGWCPGPRGWAVGGEVVITCPLPRDDLSTRACWCLSVTRVVMISHIFTMTLEVAAITPI